MAVCSEGGYNIGYIAVGEWLAYDVNITQTGNYTLTARVATDWEGTRSLHLEIGGVDVSGPISFTTVAGGGWQTFFDASVTGVPLTAGVQEIRVVFDSGDFNLNYIDFALEP